MCVNFSKGYNSKKNFPLFLMKTSVNCSEKSLIAFIESKHIRLDRWLNVTKLLAHITRFLLLSFRWKEKEL